MEKNLDGKKISLEIKNQIQEICKNYNKTELPTLGILQVGNLEESNIYVKHKMQMAESLGLGAILVKLQEDSSEQEIKKAIKSLSNQTDGLIVQLPMISKNIKNVQELLNEIPFEKDIDGLTSFNLDSNYSNDCQFLPATAKGIILLLKAYNIDFSNKIVGVVGQSNIVGKPLSKYFEKRALKTFSYTKETPKDTLKLADLVIVATGQKNAVTVDMLKDNVILVDVGIHRDANNKISGDMDYKECLKKCSLITPVPGGVGPMTVIALIINLIKAYVKKHQNKSQIFQSLFHLFKPI
ncbi:bifunctional 5,10-methylenetetrahydrofolate dehydrogenase/5,10-methenyltetrahydrofolate cyclohydrolase [[Mycoplasma] anseris]|uniref:Bifunctional protein FolD n=1 Tax=[Mycoplasma] anseris TaxID=92400 RepID=A0A2Z4NCD3_9BACT|nr:bifunctional 5,10-methylenetetrahydrofolate dehydrogenase/5,10-methenyltetrahydrofolate cyclohydrolase [[Mycoplasma] anseris]AWX69218.1 bifunctional 5,10-methylenetetrahydrofolate dehydrogenase/5,10-methenyltetrahydrofolate cyclohydrolase [[Mycoplasma] anseris]